MAAWVWAHAVPEAGAPGGCKLAGWMVRAARAGAPGGANREKRPMILTKLNQIKPPQLRND
jgi:hypothetical protein